MPDGLGGFWSAFMAAKDAGKGNQWRDTRTESEEEDPQQGEGRVNVVPDGPNPDGKWPGGVYDYDKGEWEEGYEKGPGAPPPGGSQEQGGSQSGFGRPSGRGWGR